MVDWNFFMSYVRGALYAIWLRVADHGWTPGRLFILLVAVVGLAYGLIYAVAVLR